MKNRIPLTDEQIESIMDESYDFSYDPETRRVMCSIDEKNAYINAVLDTLHVLGYELPDDLEGLLDDIMESY